MKALLVLLTAICFTFPVLAESPRISHSPREPGRVMLRELAVRDGLVVIRTDSNGCTQKNSFKVEVKKEGGLSAGVPHYRISIERTVIDECKALVWEGLQIEFDLAKDMGLSGEYTISVENPVLSKSAHAR